MKTILSLFYCLIFLTSSVTAQNRLDNGIGLYKKGSYKEAVEILKDEVKKNPKNAEIWLYLASSQLQSNKLKDAEKSYKKLVEIDNANPSSHSGLAYLYLLKNNLDLAKEEADSAIKIDNKSLDAHYVLGIIAFRNGFYDRSYSLAKKVITLNTNHASGYLLKAESLISSFIQQAGTVMRPTSNRTDLLKEADEDLQKYVSLNPNGKNISFYKEYSDSIKFFADYYTDKAKSLPTDVDTPTPVAPNSSDLKLTAKPRANYTDQARQAGVTGSIKLLVNFSESKVVKNILVIKSLGYGLDQEAVMAAKNIKFQPATKDGKPVSTVKTVQYNFSLY